MNTDQTIVEYINENFSGEEKIKIKQIVYDFIDNYNENSFYDKAKKYDFVNLDSYNNKPMFFPAQEPNFSPTHIISMIREAAMVNGGLNKTDLSYPRILFLFYAAARPKEFVKNFNTANMCELIHKILLKTQYSFQWTAETLFFIYTNKSMPVFSGIKQWDNFFETLEENNLFLTSPQKNMFPLFANIANPSDSDEKNYMWKEPELQELWEKILKS